MTDIGKVLRGYHYFIRNNSPLPIYDVVLHIGAPGEGQAGLRAVLPPGEDEVISPRNSRNEVFGRFMDSSGIAWQRNGAGKSIGRLTELKEYSDPFPM